MARDASARKSRTAEFAEVPVRAFFVTLAVFLLAGGLLGAIAHSLLRESPTPWPWVAAALAVLESAAAGVIVGFRQAASRSVAYGLASLRLGRTLVRLIFERFGGPITEGLRRLPLDRAEAMLKDGVVNALTATRPAGRIRAWVQAKLLAAVERYTLSRFRSADAGGIDPVKVQAELEETIDARLASGVLVALRAWSFGAFIMLAGVVLAQTLLIRHLTE